MVTQQNADYREYQEHRTGSSRRNRDIVNLLDEQSDLLDRMDKAIAGETAALQKLQALHENQN
jgi:hypothetical protein